MVLDPAQAGVYSATACRTVSVQNESAGHLRMEVGHFSLYKVRLAHPLNIPTRNTRPCPVLLRRKQSSTKHHDAGDKDGVPLTVEGGGSGESPC